MIFRRAIPDEHEINKMRSLLFEHGTNDWNYLPESGVDRELRDAQTGNAITVLMEEAGSLLGLAFGYPTFIRFPNLVPAFADPKAFAYVGDIVIHRDFVGCGFGSQLLKAICTELISSGAETIFIACHEENRASRGMMRKCGFEIAAIVADPDRRFVGSRKTSILKWSQAVSR